MSNLAIAVAFLTLSAAHAADLEWGPYLQDVRAGRTTILWTTRGGSGVGAVRYFSSSGPVDVASTVTALPASLTDLPQDIWLHRAVLRGLDAGTEYRYVVLIDGKEAAADPSQRFATAGSGPFRFLVIGDTGDNGAGQRELAQPLLREAAAFLLHAGDIAYWDGTFQQYQAAYFGIYGTLLARMAVFPAPGNHDISNGALAYRTIFDPPQDNVPAIARNLYYSFDWANAHFTVLDSNQPLTAGSPMLSWLEQDLTQTSQTWRIVAIHHPPFTSTPNKRDDPICKLVLKELTPVFERHGVHLVISGHEHIYQRTQPRLTGVWMPRGPGVVYVTSGGGGSQNYEPGKEPFLAASAGGPHYLRIDVTESALQVEAVDSAAKVLDRWELKAAPELAEFGVVDAAAFSRQIAPGGLVSIFGWNLSGATVRDTLRPWPVLYAGRAQINAQVPFEIEDRATLSVTTGRGTVTAPILVTAIAPNIFTVYQDGRQTAAVIHQDGRLVTQREPAAPGEWVSIYATGLGKISGRIETGARAPMSPLLETLAPVHAQIDSRAIEVSVACLAPGFVGLYQINARIPFDLAAGTHNLQLTGAAQAGNAVPIDIR